VIVLPPIHPPALRATLSRLRRSLARLDAGWRRDLAAAVADPARIGAAGLTAGVYALDPHQPDRLVDPITAVLLLRGETTWPALAAMAATCFDALHDTPSWNEDDAYGAAVEDVNDALDAFAAAAGWAQPGHGPASEARVVVAGKLQRLLGRLLEDQDADDTRPSRWR